MLSPFPHLNRRHFMKHMAGTAALGVSGINFAQNLAAAETALKKNDMHLIIAWMGGGPPTLDFWNIYEGEANSGESVSMKTKAPGIEINELLPKIAGQMDKLSLLRALNSREGDHMRGTVRFNTGFAPDTIGVRIPHVGALVSYFCGDSKSALPSFVSVGGAHGDAGFLGNAYAPFQCNNPGTPPENIQFVSKGDATQTAARAQRSSGILGVLENNFADGLAPHMKASERKSWSDASQQHRELVAKALDISTKTGPEAFTFGPKEQAKMAEYGNTGFGRSCLLASKLVEKGVTVVEVNEGGWDLHGNVFPALRNKLPVIDNGIGSMVKDLREKGLLEKTAIVLMGDFNRTPRINQGAGRDHWSATVQVLIGGAGIKGGVAHGETTPDNMQAKKDQSSIGEMWATVYEALCPGLLADRNRDPHDNIGRRFYLTDGGKENATPIKALVG